MKHNPNKLRELVEFAPTILIERQKKNTNRSIHLIISNSSLMNVVIN